MFQDGLVKCMLLKLMQYHVRKIVIFYDENLQVYAGYSFDLKANRGIMKINVMKLRASLD